MAVSVYFGPHLKQSLAKKSMGSRKWRLWGAAVAACLVLAVGAGAEDAAPVCTAVRTLFDAKGMLSAVDIQDAPNSDGGGLCSTRGCCGEGAKARLSSSAKQQLEAALRADLNKLSTVLAARAHRFDEFFKSLLQQSKQEFHEMFKRTYGMIYERHSYVFTDLFAELERYYTSGDVDLVQLMDKFFIVLYQKMFTVLNSQYNFDDKYLQCVSEHMRETQPFDDVPHKLSIQLRRAFVATRTFQKALQAGAEVAKNMNEVGVSVECATAWARMRWCGACASGGVGTSPPACSRFCINVVRGCLPLHADLAHHWDAYVDAVDKVSDRLLGPFNIAMVVEPIDIKISEAIMNFQEHSQDISQKIFASCGKPVLGSVPANAPAGPFFGPGKRERRSIGSDETYSLDIFDSQENANSELEDFEIEASYESIANKHPFLRRSSVRSSEEYDINDMEYLKEKAEERQRFLEYMKGSINSKELDSYRRARRDADPEPASKGSKEIDFEPYKFEGNSRSAKRKGKKPTSVGKVVSSKESPVDLGGVSGGGGGGGEVLERLVRESRARVRNTRKYWSHLPYVLCNDDEVAASPSPDVRCYNGTTIASYQLSLAGEGMTALATNPELRAAPPSKAAVLHAAQETLRTITTKLKNAYNGLDVDWRDYAEDSASLFYGSGSGSGDADDDITDDDEDRQRIYDEFPASGHGPITDDDELMRRPELPETPTQPDEAVEPPFTPGVVAAPVDTHNVNMKDASHERTDHYQPQTEVFQTKIRKVEYEKPADTPPVREAPSTGAAARTEMSLQRAVVAYLFPIVCAWFGGIVNDIV